MREHRGGGDEQGDGGHRRRHHHHHHHHGAKTFRRGRALEFLNVLDVKRLTLKQQLEAPEYGEIRPILLGELKAIDMVIEEYTRHFELRQAGEEANPEAGNEEGDQGT
ncbi:hypothetical protein [Cohnella zeiphila]|nr:hypothetical protein [Cohnella zeiphila]